MTTRTRTRRRRGAAFTLIEMIAVLVIIGLILGIGIPTYMKHVEGARQTSAMAQTKLMYQALASFNMDVGRFPSEEQGLMALIEQPSDVTNWGGPYVENWTKIPMDPWNREYKYMFFTDDNGRDQAKVICLGKDGLPGGTGLNADIINGEVMEDADTGT